MTTTPPQDQDPQEGVPSESPDLRPEQVAPAPGVEQPPPAPGPRRLYRSKADSWFGGVAGGLAQYFDTDPTLVRVAFVVIAFLSAGFAIIGYIAAWIVIPEEPAPGAAAARRSGGNSGAIAWGLLLVLVGVVVLLGQLDLDIDFALWEAGAAVALILVGLYIVVEARRGLNGGLVTLAFLLTLVLGFARITDFDLNVDGAFGSSTARVTSLEQLDDSYSHVFGSLTVDLRDLDIPTGETVRVDVSVGFGEAEILLPPGVPARLSVSSVFGSVDGEHVETDGIATDRDYTPPGWNEADRRLDVSLSTVFGSGRTR